MEVEHGADMLGHRGARGAAHRLRIGLAALLPLGDGPALRQVAVDRIVRRGLVGDGVGPHAAPHQLGEDVDGVAQQPDRHRLLRPVGLLDHRQRLVEAAGLLVEIARAQAHLDARGLAFDGQARGARHHRGERLRAAHAAQARRQDPFAGEAAAIVPAAELGEGLVGALDDALAADIDPRARRHLAEHHQALAVELVEMLPGRPVRHDVGIGDQHARRVAMGAEHADRLAGLHEQRLVALEAPQRRDDAIEALPVARRPADAAIDHELARLLGDVGIEIVHQHAHRRLGQPALGREVGAARRADHAHVVDACHDVRSMGVPCQTRE